MTPIKTQHLPSYRLEDYNHWQGDWELIRGIPFSMSPSANKLHQRTARSLLLLLQEALDQSSCTCELFYELDLIIDNHTVVRPDMMIFCEEIRSDYPDSAPALVVEIISAGSRQMDREIKMEIYRDFGILNYLVVDPEHQTLEHYLLMKDSYHQVKNKTTPIILGDCSIAVALERLFPEK
ncbi:MAG: Uma2 family endonuclease [Saprospiraceae bacterium]|nr:Uma2 family endonuclease [Saprospiraceae bacterium]